MNNLIKIILLSMILLFAVNIVSADNGSYVELTYLNQDPDPAEAGDYVELRFKAEKLGIGEIENAEYELVIDYPFSFDESDNAIRETGKLKTYADDDWYYAFKYKLRVDKDAVEGTYKFDIKEKYNNASHWTTTEYEIEVGENNKPSIVIGSLVTSPTKLVSDTDEAELEIEFQNIGDASAKHAIAELELPQGIEATYGYSDRANLGLIGSGQSKSAKFYIDTDKYLKSGTYSTTVTVQYKEENDKDNEYKTIELPVDIHVKSKPMFEIVSVKTIPATLLQAESAQIMIEVKNIGENAESVSLRAFKESSQPFEFEEKSDYIGNLDNEEMGTAILKIDIDNDATPKTYIIDIELRSIDSDEVIIQQEAVQVVIDENPKQQSFTQRLADSILGMSGWLIAIILIAITAFIGIRVYRKTK